MTARPAGAVSGVTATGIAGVAPAVRASSMALIAMICGPDFVT